MKNKIISEFWETRNTDAPSAYYEIYNTSLDELNKIYDTISDVVASGVNFNDFLFLSGAVTKTGEIVCDRKVRFYDKVTKKDEEVRISFMYPVYSWFYKKIISYENYIKEIKWADLLEGDFNSVTQPKYIELFIKGLEKAKEKINKPDKIDSLIQLATKRLSQVNKK